METKTEELTNEESIDVKAIMKGIRETIKDKEKDPSYKASLELVNNTELILDLPTLSTTEDLESNISLMNKYVLPTSPRIGIRKKVTDLIHRKIFLSVSIMMENVIRTQENFNRATFSAIQEIWHDFSKIQKDVKDSLKKTNQLDTDIRKIIGEIPSHKASIIERVLELEQKSRFDNFPYYNFEEEYRGSHEKIMEKQKMYLKYFKDKQKVIDLGSGRGEFLSLLKENGIDAIGVDLNHDMILNCQSLGLNVVEEDAVSYLKSVPENSLGGLFAAQFIEHIPFYTVVEMLKSAHDKLSEESYVVLESINPESLFVFTSALYLDPSHTIPLHPKTMAFLLKECGYKNVEIIYSSPIEEQNLLEHVPDEENNSDKYNKNVDKLNSILFAPQDYAVIGRK